MKLLNILIFFIILVNLVFLGYFTSTITGDVIINKIEYANLTRAIDGDTIDTDIGRVRLLGINTPEKKQPYYEEAKSFLKNFEGKTVEVEIHEKDKYDRTLAYVKYQGSLINKQLLSNGLATLYYYEKDKYYQEMKLAESQAINQELGLWKKSTSSSCLELIKLQYKEQERCNNQEQLILNNKCSKLNIIIKDDANHISSQEISQGIFIQNFSCVFNDEGDSLYIRDDSGLLLFYRY